MRTYGGFDGNPKHSRFTITCFKREEESSVQTECQVGPRTGMNGVEGRGRGKAFLVTGRGGPVACETSRLPHFLHNRLRIAVKLSASRCCVDLRDTVGLAGFDQRNHLRYSVPRWKDELKEI
jgi:hypothetical protein